MNKLKMKEVHYITIVPDNNLKSFNQFKSIIKKCFRDISKLNYIKSHKEHYNSKNYLKYVSVIEINSSITKNKKLLNDRTFFTRRPRNISDDFIMNEMRYHTHIFYQPFVMNKRVSSKVLKCLVEREFSKHNIEVNIHLENEFYDLNTFVKYHTKQLNQLDNNFIISNN